MAELDISTQIKGLKAAQLRLHESWADRELALIATYECLNWIVTIQELWRGSRTMREWTSTLEHRMKLIVLAHRYVRNAVHHNWANALSLARSGGASFPIQFPAIWGEWTWVEKLDNPVNNYGKAEYHDVLARKSARVSILEFIELVDA